MKTEPSKEDLADTVTHVYESLRGQSSAYGFIGRQLVELESLMIVLFVCLIILTFVVAIKRG